MPAWFFVLLLLMLLLMLLLIQTSLVAPKSKIMSKTRPLPMEDFRHERINRILRQHQQPPLSQRRFTWPLLRDGRG